MCGIVGYVGPKDATPIIIDGLKKLEYRGYDSAGLAVINKVGTIDLVKKEGKVADLVSSFNGTTPSGNIGIGHTRWATHGAPSDINAHPHSSQRSDIVVVHNGIIENYAVLKETLEKRGHTFQSETDTEVLVHLIEEIKNKQQIDIEEAVRLALTEITGAYALVVLDQSEPDKLVCARKASPLVVGLGKDEYLIASDATPIIEHTRKVVYLNDYEIAVVHRNGHLKIVNVQNEVQNPFIQELNMEIEQIEKGGYDHFMLKEIYEQPKTARDGMRGRINAKEGWIKLGGFDDYKNRFLNCRRLIFVACGTSWHAGLVGEYLIEEYARIPVEVEYASEFRYRNPVLDEKDIVIALSQSGETADTLAALELAKNKEALIYGIVNIVGSSISRMTDAGSYIHAGPEIGVASTKAFTGQLTILLLLTLTLAHEKGTISNTRLREMLYELENIPSKMEKIMKLNDEIEHIAREIKDSTNALYLGRGFNFPIALEGALKLKEISYIHAEGYPAAEMKHGPIALIDEDMPVIVIATNPSAYEKILSNVQEVKARNGFIISIVNEGEQEISKISDYSIKIPSTIEAFGPLLSVIPLQLLSYHIALMRGCNVDQPRNLAKSVTVE
jgi:glucosamine--fructose-6-phosphate aminotransferase (isomerizing)